MTEASVRRRIHKTSIHLSFASPQYHPSASVLPFSFIEFYNFSEIVEGGQK